MLRVRTSDLLFLFCLLFVFIFLSIIFWTIDKQSELRRKARLQLKWNSSISMNRNASKEGTKEDGDSDTTDSSEIEDLGIDMHTYPPCHTFKGMRWLHHIATGECYEVGTQGPCMDSMTFYANPDKDFKTIGFCDCDDIVEVKSNNPDCESVERPLIYYAPMDRCFTVFSQGPCKEGEWVTLNESLKPLCSPNMCPHNEGDDEFSLKFWFAHQGKCYENLSRGYCPKGHKLRISKYNWKPQCFKENDDSCQLSYSVNIPALKCRPGNKLNQLGKCIWSAKQKKLLTLNITYTNINITS